MSLQNFSYPMNLNPDGDAPTGEDPKTEDDSPVDTDEDAN